MIPKPESRELPEVTWDDHPATWVGVSRSVNDLRPPRQTRRRRHEVFILLIVEQRSHFSVEVPVGQAVDTMRQLVEVYDSKREPVLRRREFQVFDDVRQALRWPGAKGNADGLGRGRNHEVANLIRIKSGIRIPVA